MNLEKLNHDISLLGCSNNIKCFLFYGSFFTKNLKDITDSDIIVVLKDMKEGKKELSDYIYNNFPNPDLHVYSTEEIENDLAFHMREYILEYLSKGYTLYGENVFEKKFSRVTQRQYRESILVRSFTHVQMVRKIYFNTNYGIDHKSFYVKKYIIRLSKNILLFKGLNTYDELDYLSDEQVMEIVQKNNLLDMSYSYNDTTQALEYFFRLFCDLGHNLIELRKELVSEPETSVLISG